MKIMSRNFTIKETILLLILAAILLGLVYYWFVDQPVREAITKAQAECEAIRQEKEAVDLELARLQAMEKDLGEIESSGRASYMGSYNNSEEELRLLNDILSDAQQYSISFSDVTRNGDQIRRNFTLQFKTADYAAARSILERLGAGEYRCLIGDIRCSTGSNDIVTVNASATFYETMVGGTPDAGLPASSQGQG